MRANRALATAVGIAAVAGLFGPELSGAQQPNTFTVIATGLQAPRGDSEEDAHLALGFSPGSGYHIVSSKAGFTTVVAVDFGPDGLLYALELSDAAGFPTPSAGKVVRVKHSGEIEEVITQLNVPTGMTFGSDGRLYISDFGAVPAPAFGIGRILRFDVAPGW